MRLMLVPILSLTLCGFGCAWTEITGFKDPAFRNITYHDVVVMARSGDRIRDKATESEFVQCLSKRKVQARPSMEILPPTRTFDAQEVLKELGQKGVEAMLLINLKEQWTVTGFKDGTSWSEPREKSAVQVIDVKSGSVAWVASTSSSGNLLANDQTMISSLASRTTAALIKEGIVRPPETTAERSSTSPTSPRFPWFISGTGTSS